MGVSVEGGSGRRKSMMIDLNLVPFIDYMSCLIAFLMVGAVWSQLAAIETAQSVGDGDDLTPGPPPMTVHVRADGTWAGRQVEQGVELADVEGGQDLAGLRRLLDTDRATLPEERLIVINTDDGVPYERMVAVLDLSRELGYEDTLLAGGPVAAR